MEHGTAWRRTAGSMARRCGPSARLARDVDSSNPRCWVRPRRHARQVRLVLDRGLRNRIVAQQNNPVLPRGVTQATFEKALEAFRALLGEENVLAQPSQLTPYSKVMMSVENDAHAPSAALTVSSVEQVQGVVRICNEHKIPIWPISTGRNFGYGSAAPVQRGQVILDLKKMNRILKVDPDMCYALVEPGVTYQQLYDYIEENNLPLMLSFPAPSAIASPLGNIMDRGVGYTPYGEHFMMQCGMEVVLANGD